VLLPAIVLLTATVAVHGDDSTALNETVARVKAQFQSNCASGTYDLSTLAGAVFPGTDSIYNYLLNVCGTVSSEPNCASHNGSLCQYSTSTPPVFVHVLNHWTSDGDWAQLDPNDPSKGVQVTFENGDVCGVTKLPRQVIHQFPCTPGVLGDSYTIVTNAANPCQYTLTFPTSASCQNSSIQGCRPTVAGFTFDLSPLYDENGLNATDKNGYLYRWNPCGVMAGDPRCAAANATLCQSFDALLFQLALWNVPPQPQWALIDPNRASRGVVATYTNGQICRALGKPRTVIQQFECAPETSAYTIVELPTCQYTITIASPVACPLNP